MTTNDSNHDKTQIESSWITIISGSIAGSLATIVKQPLSRIKWLKQVSEYHTIVQEASIPKIAKHIVKSEGAIRGLWRGTFSAIARNVPHSILIFSLYPIFRQTLSKSSLSYSYSIRTTNVMLNALSGSLASLFTSLITHPLDTIRVRIAVQYGIIEYKSYVNTYRSIIANEGFHSLYYGLGVTLVGTVIRGGVGFGIYESIKSNEMKEWNANQNFPIVGRLLFGFMAGGISTVVSYPLDTIRRRQQVYGTLRIIDNAKLQTIGGQFQSHLHWKSAIRFIFVNEGWKGFFKGMTLGLIKTPIASAVSLTVNDIVKRYMGWNS